jgi:hypothetical protein
MNQKEKAAANKAQADAAAADAATVDQQAVLLLKCAGKLTAAGGAPPPPPPPGDGSGPPGVQQGGVAKPAPARKSKGKWFREKIQDWVRPGPKLCEFSVPSVMTGLETGGLTVSARSLA